jgi:TRAP-type C4-dicarboxylate transport system permease large subunit
LDGEIRSRRTRAGGGYTAHVEMDRMCHVEAIYKIALVVVLLVVIFSLGQALYFMMTDKDDDKRTVWALTRRIGLSLLLIAMVAFGIWMGWLHPHDIGQ